MKKIILPEKYTHTIIKLAKKDKLIDYYDFDNGDFSVYETDNHRLNRKIEQLFYQLLFLYDEVVLTDWEFELYDISKLANLDNITYLDYDEQLTIISEKRLNNIVPSLEYDFSQYIKPAIIHDIKKDMSSFYKIKKKNYSDYQFASKYYDILFSEKAQQQRMTKKYGDIYDINALYYHVRSELNRHEVRPTEFNDNMLAIIARYLDPILRDFELAKENGIEILDPSYAIEKLGLESKKGQNIADIYGTLKTECQNIIPTLPSFSSIYDVLEFKEKKSSQIKRLREEIDHLEHVLMYEGKEKMLIQAANDVKKAAKELCQGEKTTAIDKFSLYFALPAGLLEYYASLPPIISIPLTICGISSYCRKKYMVDKNSWVRIIR